MRHPLTADGRSLLTAELRWDLSVSCKLKSTRQALTAKALAAYR